MERNQMNVKDWSQSAQPRRGRGRPKGKPTPFTAALTATLQTERKTRNAELERERRDTLASAFSGTREAIGLHDRATRQEILIAATKFIKRHAGRDCVVALRRQNADLQRQIVILEKAEKERREPSSKTAPTLKLEPSSASSDMDYDNIPPAVPFKTEPVVDTEPYARCPGNTPFSGSFTATPKIDNMLIFGGTREYQNPMLSSFNVKVTAWERPHTAASMPDGYLTPTEEDLPVLFPDLD